MTGPGGGWCRSGDRAPKKSREVLEQCFVVSLARVFHLAVESPELLFVEALQPDINHAVSPIAAGCGFAPMQLLVVCENVASFVKSERFFGIDRRFWWRLLRACSLQE